MWIPLAKIRNYDIIYDRPLLSADGCEQIRMEETTMAYKISDDCISCGACAENCPTEAIYEADGKYEIDADKCIDCGSCADACPVEAPKAE